MFYAPRVKVKRYSLESRPQESRATDITKAAVLEIFYVKSLTIFHSSLFLTNLTLIIRHFPMPNGTIPSLMSRNLFLTSLVRVWYFWMTLV